MSGMITKWRAKTKKFPKCLPSQEDLEAVYLGKTLPSDVGLVTDESGNSNDAQLVNSQCAKLDGVTTIFFNSAKDFNIGDMLEIYANFNAVTGTSYFIGGLNENGLNSGIRYNGTDFLAYCGSGGVTRTVAWTKEDRLAKFGCKRISAGDYEIYIDDVLLGVSGMETSFNWTVNSIGTRAGSLGFTGCVAGFKMQNTEYALAEGGLSTTLNNSGTDTATAYLINATIPDFWSEYQDVFHYNFLQGFDLYENGNAGEEIRVPIGATFSQSGYTYTATYQAGIWHNGAETEIDLSDTLKAVIDLDITDPLGYDDFQTFYGDSAMSNTEEGKKKKLVFYDRDLTTDEKVIIQKCIDAKTGVDVWKDSEGTIVYDTNGILATDN